MEEERQRLGGNEELIEERGWATEVGASAKPGARHRPSTSTDCDTGITHGEQRFGEQMQHMGPRVKGAIWV